MAAASVVVVFVVVVAAAVLPSAFWGQNLTMWPTCLHSHLPIPAD